MPSRILPVRNTKAVLGAVASLLLFGLSCDSSTDPGPGSQTSLQLSTVTASQASIVADGKTTSIITVALKDAQGASLGKSGGTVTIAATRGSIGAVADQNNGSYTATLTSSTSAGSSVITASVSGAALANSATVSFVAGPAAQIAVGNASSNGQSAAVGSNVTNPPSVKITDANGNAVSGVTVTFAIASGGGSVTGGTQTTDGTGVATVGSWRLGNNVGANTLTATVSGAAISAGVGSSALADLVFTFTATAIAGTAGSIAINAGNAQTATVGTAVTTAPSVKVSDASGNPVNGASVTFFIAGGGGSLTGATTTTNASGIATVGSWTLGDAAGTNTITAGAVGIAGTVTISATGVAGAPAAIAIANASSNNQNAAAGTAVAIPPSVKVTDAKGNAVAGVSVTFAVTSGGGSITGATASTNASGVAQVGSWTVGSSAGPNSLTATLNGLSGQSVTFNATGTAFTGLSVSVTGRIERSETITVTVVQDGVTLSPASFTLSIVPVDGGTVNADGTIKLLKTGSLTINAQAGTRSGSAGVTVAQPPLIVFDLVRNFSRQIWQVAIDGGDLLQITTVGSDNQHPSRVGSKVVYAGARNGRAFDIFSLNLSTATETQLTNTTWADRDPNYSPNGNRLVYMSNESGLDRAVYSNADGSNVGFVDDISNNTGAVEISPAWSPGSDKVILSTTATGGTPDIWIQHSLGGVATKMPAPPVNTTAAEINPVWNSAGKIAFHTTRSGSNEIFVTDPTGATATKMTDGAAPTWLPDGRLVFVRFTGATGSLFWVDLANPSVVHPIDVGGGDAQRPSGVLP